MYFAKYQGEWSSDESDHLSYDPNFSFVALSQDQDRPRSTQTRSTNWRDSGSTYPHYEWRVSETVGFTLVSRLVKIEPWTEPHWRVNNE